MNSVNNCIANSILNFKNKRILMLTKMTMDENAAK